MNGRIKLIRKTLGISQRELWKKNWYKRHSCIKIRKWRTKSVRADLKIYLSRI